MEGLEKVPSTVIQTPSWAVWLLGFFAFMVLVGGGALINEMRGDIHDNTKDIVELKVEEAHQEERVLGMASILGKIEDKVDTVISNQKVAKALEEQTIIDAAEKARKDKVK